VNGHLARFVGRRALAAALLVWAVSSAALLLAASAPGDHLSDFGLDPAIAAAERRRAGLDAHPLRQAAAWLGRAVRLDLGESLKYRRPVGALVRERAVNSLRLGGAALVLATLIGIPLGVFTGSRGGGLLPAAARGSSLLMLCVPPLVTSLVLLVIASRTGWLPVGGLPPPGSGLVETMRHFVLPILALALPVAASLERLQSRALAHSLGDPSVAAARARGLSARRVVGRHALRLSLGPVLGVYGIIIGSLLSGSFAVEYVMSWPGLGLLMFDGIQYRDPYLVAGCAAAGATFLAAGIFCSDVALAVVDPRVAEKA
jgi:peptide/nickel transport system permease protein